MVVLKTVSFQNKKGFNTHRLLRAIDNNTLLSKLSKSEEGHINHMMLSKNQLLEYYQEFPQLIANTQDLMDKCHMSTSR